MTIVDEIFEEAGKDKTVELKPFDKNEWAMQKKQERETIYQLIDQSAMESVSSVESLETVLNVMARFDRYSVGNVLLIAKQKPNATKLADFDTWKDSGALVKKGETGIMILGPGREFAKEDGSVGVTYNTRRLFDISQTTSQIEIAPAMTDTRTLLKGLLFNPPCEIVIDDTMRYPSNRFTVYDREEMKIFVRPGCSEAEMFQELSHQMSCVLFEMADYDLPDRDFVSACASYVTCARYHIEPPKLRFEHIVRRANFETPKDIRNALDTVRELAGHFSLNMAQYMKMHEKRRDDGAR